VRNALLALPNAREAYDLWNRPSDLAEGSRIAELVIDGRSSLLDVPAPRREVSLAEETAAIREQLARICVALYGSASPGGPPGTLRYFLTTT